MRLPRLLKRGPTVSRFKKSGLMSKATIGVGRRREGPRLTAYRDRVLLTTPKALRFTASTLRDGGLTSPYMRMPRVSYRLGFSSAPKIQRLSRERLALPPQENLLSHCGERAIGGFSPLTPVGYRKRKYTLLAQVQPRKLRA